MSPLPAASPTNTSPSGLLPPNPITTPRLLLRAARPSDLAAFHSLLSNPAVMHYWSCPPHTTLTQSESSLAEMMASPNNGLVDFVIVLADSGTVIGKAGVWSALPLPGNADANRCPQFADIGFLLDSEYWGKGFMYEALTAMMPRVWEQRVDVVRADVDPRNGRSLGVLKRLGFVEVGRKGGTLRTHLGLCDSVFLELKKGGKGRNVIEHGGKGKE